MNTNHLPESMYLQGEREAEIAALRQAETYTFSVEFEDVVVGHDLEYADMDNPKGEIVRARYFMVATTPAGRQYRYGFERTEALAEAKFQYLAPPVSEWSKWRCIYGSEAYEQDHCELQQLADEMDEDFRGTGRNWMCEAPEVAARMIEAGVR